MRPRIATPELLTAIVVLIHLGVSMVHGAAHARANVALPPASMVFVFTVIFIGPVAGLIVQRAGSARLGAWLIAVTLTGALVFGLANHFLIPGADHVAHVSQPWRAMFGTTAALLAITEGIGSVLAVRCATRDRR